MSIPPMIQAQVTTSTNSYVPLIPVKTTNDFDLYTDHSVIPGIPWRVRVGWDSWYILLYSQTGVR